jgi:hypothetical protein
MPTVLEHLDKHRSQVHTRSGSASYIDTGGPGHPALFVHGLGTSSYLWRHLLGQLNGQRRCVAVDLPLHRQTPAAADQDFSLPGLARFLADCCDALELTGVDPAPPTSSRSMARACSSPTSAPPNSPRHCAAIGTPTPGRALRNLLHDCAACR